MQSGIEVGEDGISGTIERLTGYTGFSDKPEEQEGYYLALSMAANEGARITTELIGGTGGEVDVTDGYCVDRITDKETQRIKITVRKDDDVVEKEYSLADLSGVDHLHDNKNEKLNDNLGGDLEGQIQKEL